MEQFKSCAQKYLRKHDNLFFLLILVLAVGAHFMAILNRAEWGDLVIYVLPSANYVSGEGFNLHQLGNQFYLNEGWRLNSPLMGIFPILPFYLFGIGIIQYLCVLALIDILLFYTFYKYIQKNTSTLKIQSILIAFSFLGMRHIYGELYNQRYTLLGYPIILILFAHSSSFKDEKTKRYLKSLAFGLLPIIHPSMLIAWIAALFYLLMNFGAIKQTTTKEKIEWGAAPIILGVSAFIWYFATPLFSTQFRPHVEALSGIVKASIFEQSTWFLNNITTHTVVFFLLFTSLVLLSKRFLSKKFQSNNYEFYLASILCFIFVLDFFYGFLYSPAYIIPIGMILTVSLINKYIKFLFILLGALNVILALKADYKKPQSTYTLNEQIEFILNNSNPHDQIVLGAPFILASSQEKLLQGRKISGVVPNSIALHFDDHMFRDSLAKLSTLYIGDEEHFKHPIYQYWDLPTKPYLPLFESVQENRKAYLNGIEISIIRK